MEDRIIITVLMVAALQLLLLSYFERLVLEKNAIIMQLRCGFRLSHTVGSELGLMN
jgi:hypothetical protein